MTFDFLSCPHNIKLLGGVCRFQLPKWNPRTFIRT
jgi:hypothetical protein